MLTVGAESKGSEMQYTASTGDIIIAGLAGKAPFDRDFDEPLRQKRKYCRYVRDDIQISVTENRFLFRKKTKTARLLNVSPLGVSIRYPIKLKRGQRVLLILTFQGGRAYEFKGVVVYRRSVDQEIIYGLNFEKLNYQFEEHLLKTGLRLKLNKLSMTA